MKLYLQCIYRLLVLFGIDPLKTINVVKGCVFYFRDLHMLRQQWKASNIRFRLGKPYPCFGERFSESGTAKGHYFHQDLLVSRRIFVNKPKLHVDVGSRIDGFVAHVASFRDIEVFDVRSLTTNIPNVKFVRADLMETIGEDLVDYCDSLSCLHALEHFGLGRYGDTLKYDGYVDALNNMHKILEHHGKFYLSVPIGPQRIEFNAHRVFSLQYLLDLFKEKYVLDYFSYVDDQGNLHNNANLTEDKVRNNFGCSYGCGIFEMTKI